MSISCLILGESGSGKTASLRNLDPAKTLLIQPIRKPLPFRAKGWREGKGGNIFVSDEPARILDVMRRAPEHFEVIVVDDWQYVLANKEGENTPVICEQLYDLALLSHRQLTPEEMTKFVARSNEIMLKLAQ